MVSEDLKKFIFENHPFINDKKVEINPTGVRLDRFDFFDRSFNETVVLCVARQVKNKGIETLVESAKILESAGVDFKFLIVGDGPDLEFFKEYSTKLGIQEKIEFVGGIPNQKIVEFYKMASVFVLPSKMEGLPNVILEAMATGLPVIATKVGGIPEIVKEGVNGFLIDIDDSQGLADRIQRLADNPVLAKDMGRMGRTIAENYDVRKQVKKVFDYWRSL